MKGSKIGGTVSSTVTLGTGNYLSPLTVLSHGVVAIGTAGDAIFGSNSQSWTVVNQGLVQVSASSGNGIELDAGGFVDNSGTIIAPHNGVYITGAAGTVVDSGVIAATAADAIDLQNGGEVNIANKGTVSTTVGTFFAAVYIGGAAGSVVDQGKIISNARDGIDLAKGGRVSIGATGSVNSTYTGTSYGAGVYIGGAAGTVVNHGKINATGNSKLDGIALYEGGSVDNSGTITAATGVFVDHAAGKVVNSGKIIVDSSGFFGVDLYAGGSFTNTAHGYVQGAIGGYNGSTAVVNEGRIIEADGDGAIFEGGLATVVNTGTLEGFGKFLNGSNLIDGAEGIFLGDGGTVTNGVRGSHRALIEGYHVGVLAGGAAAATVTNFGKIEGTQTATSGFSGAGIGLLGGGSVMNAGTIIGQSGVGVSSHAGTITNAGTIIGTSLDAVALYDGGNVNVGKTGLLTASTGAGVYVAGDAGTVVNSGRILSSRDNGVDLYYGGLVVNHGLIQSHGNYSSLYAGGEFADGGSVTIENSGTITNAGNYDGVHVVKAAGVYLLNSRGVISGGDVAVYVGGLYGKVFPESVGTVVNSGKIEGGASYGIDLAAGGTVIDSGTIAGNGTAIYFGGNGSNLLDLQAGFKIEGDIVASSLNGATNTLELSGKKKGALTFNDTTFQYFDTIKVDPKSTWTLSGDGSSTNFVNDGTVIVDNKRTFTFGTVGEDPSAHGSIVVATRGGAEFTGSVDAAQTLVFRDATGHLQLDAPKTFAATIDGFRRGDTIVLNKVTATTADFSSGTLTISNNGATVATLSMNGKYTTKEFVVTSLGANGTEITIGKPKGKPLVFTQTDSLSGGSGGPSPGLHRSSPDGAHRGFFGASEHGGKGFAPFGHGAAPAAAGGGGADVGSLLPWAGDPFHFWTIQG